MDKGKRRFNQDKRQRRPDGGKPGVRPDIRRERDDDAFAKEGATDKLEGRNAVTEALAAGRDFNKIWILKPEAGWKNFLAILRVPFFW